MHLIRRSPCKVNFVLNILGRRPDGFHDLETLFFPVPAFDELSFESASPGIALTCSHPELPVDSTNLVHRAAAAFLRESQVRSGVRIHLDKRLPLSAGIGAGSANAAVTLLALNELFGGPLTAAALDSLAAGLGSDVNFFLQDRPALATGRGERIQPLPPFTCLSGRALLLFHPGFGVPTPWAFKALAGFPALRDGKPGRAAAVAERLGAGDVSGGVSLWFNALEGPVLEKYPILALHQEFLRGAGALGVRMSGSGSTTFALFASAAEAEAVVAGFRAEFGDAGWLQVVTL
ncbi:MAG: 4-(cytidine 5'-diphospho)-2-C-methyl-D-erythritol kinase [Verrucomicrobiales bacterium]|nr:4-(cytidine 5'-diphospho)-2-C-methyl-D-erythritol kinase [Verrucomicrobiales bacterium]